MKRYELIDGLRGYFLVFMLINHLVFVGGYWMLLVNHNQLAFVEDAQGFVFLSRLLVGMVDSRKMAKTGYAQMRQKIWERLRNLPLRHGYRHGRPGGADDPARRLSYLARLARLHDIRRTASAGSDRRAALPADLHGYPAAICDLHGLRAPDHLALHERQMGLCRGRLVDPVDGRSTRLAAAGDRDRQWLDLGSDGQGIRVSFNLFGWQIVFFSGLVAGVLTANRQIDWSNILRPEATLIPKLCLMVCLFFLPLRIASAHELMPQFLLDKFATMEIRADFGPVYLLNFPAVAICLVWLLVAGPRHQSALVRRLAAGVTWLFSLSFLRLLGRHSLYVYVWHVAIVYRDFYVDQRTPEFSQVTKTLIALASVMLLSIPALWRERDRFIGGPPPRLANG